MDRTLEGKIEDLTLRLRDLELRVTELEIKLDEAGLAGPGGPSGTGQGG
jgi:hypothetical protein